MLRALVATFLVAVFVCALVCRAGAHGEAEWINRGSYKNAVGELCCGERDCAETTAQSVSLPAPGYRLPSGEFVPQDEAQPSPDGRFWVCRWGGQRKCFFAPIPTY